ncbi:MAG: S8 family serine peptidase [Flavobacteriales bacterium]
MISQFLQAQERYWVFLKDKAGTQFNPYEYFDIKAIERRLNEGLSLCDSTDFPLNELYVMAIKNETDSICGVSRWFNAIACVASPMQMKSVGKLPCVKEVVPMEFGFDLPASIDTIPTMNEAYEKAILRQQTEVMKNSRLRSAGYTGKGVRIAIFDAGFNGLIEDEAFQHIIANGRIKATYDFVRDRKFVFGHHTHGTNVLSCIAGLNDGTPMGCATDAEFVLARTEQAYKEARIEEENWVESLEWADKTGADIINSSLGYTRQFYFTQDMNGRRSMISRAASMAVSKGILVVNSAGNEGDKKWEVIAAPADADSILTIGGIDPWSGIHADFSSYGPTADNRLKPNLCAFGYAITADHNRTTINSGTSFSSPLVAGFAACIKQMHPEWRVKQVMAELQKSGSLYPYYDYAHGYGIPQADYFMPFDSTASVDQSAISFEYEPEMNRIRICIDGDSTIILSKPNETKDRLVFVLNPTPLMYIHIARPDGSLISYEMTEPGETTGAFIEEIDDQENIIRVHWKGKTRAMKIGDIMNQ